MSAFDPYDDEQVLPDTVCKKFHSFYVRAKNLEERCTRYPTNPHRIWEWFASGALVSSMIVAAFIGNAGIVLLCLLAIIIKLLTSDTMLNKDEIHITESDLELDLEEYTLEAEFRKLEANALLKDPKDRLNT